MDTCDMDARNFGWGSLVNIVPYDAVRRSHSILRNFTEVKLVDVKKQARPTWGDPAIAFGVDLPDDLVTHTVDPASEALDKPRFYHRVRAGMIRKRIEGSLDDASFKTLMLKKKDFCWTNPTTGSIDHDEPTMLQIIINGINPTTRVGVSDFKKAVQNAKLSTSSNNVKDMLDDMTSNYQEIIAQQNTHGGYTMHLFDALLTSKNEVFRSMVQRKKDDWELGGEVYNSKLIDECVTKYNNKHAKTKSLESFRF